MILAIQRRPDEDPSELWERICQACGKHTGADPQAAEMVWTVHVTFAGQSAPDTPGSGRSHSCWSVVGRVIIWVQ